LYGQQLEEWAAQGKLTLFTAFSREQVGWLLLFGGWFGVVLALVGGGPVNSAGRRASLLFDVLG
jgi:hypothetical protein